MSKQPNLKISAVAGRIHDENADGKLRVLWRAKLFIPGGNKDEFLFRSEEEFTSASLIAQKLLESRASCRMVGAQIVAVERVARLWN